MEVPAREEQKTKVAARAWCGASISEFLQAGPEAVIGELTTHSAFAVLPTQTEAWLAQIHLLKEHLAGLTGSIFLEFNIPRMACDALQERGLSPIAGGGGVGGGGENSGPELKMTTPPFFDYPTQRFDKQPHLKAGATRELK